MLKIYFAHPINVYNTPLEAELMTKILESFPGWIIENPNQEHHQDGYQRWKKEHGNGMDYYYKEVLPWCNAGIFLPFRDGKWGAGVFGEAEFLAERGWPIFQITHEGLITGIENLLAIPVLSIVDTRKRIRTESGEVIPY